MALIQCPECGKDISDRAPTCPNCGCPIGGNFSNAQEDNSKKMANLYERARKSLEVDDLEHAAEYYKEILDINPNDWEAYFYSYLGENESYTNAQAGSVASKLGSTIPSAYDMAITDDYNETASRIKTISDKTAEKLSYIAATGESLLREYEGGNILFPTGKVNSDMYAGMRPTAQNTIVSCVLALDAIIEKVEELYNDGKISEEVRKENRLILLRANFNIANKTFEPSAGVYEKLIKDEAIKEYIQQIKELDTNFQEPVQLTENSSGGCYVATAVYGSYDCPEVWTLRRFRDNTLAETWYGRTFIRIYYATSPTLVKWFGETEWFKKLWKGKLDRMVKNLNENGVEDTPYNDRKW